MTRYCCYIAQIGGKGSQKDIGFTKLFKEKKSRENPTLWYKSLPFIDTWPKLSSILSTTSFKHNRDDGQRRYRDGQNELRRQRCLWESPFVCCLYGFLLTIKLLWNRLWKPWTSPSDNWVWRVQLCSNKYFNIMFRSDQISQLSKSENIEQK